MLWQWMEERCRKPTFGVWVHLVAAWSEYEGMMMMKWCLMSSDVSWHIRDKLWPMPKHGSVYIFTSTETRRLVRTDSPTLTQLLNYDEGLIQRPSIYTQSVLARYLRDTYVRPEVTLFGWQDVNIQSLTDVCVCHSSSVVECTRYILWDAYTI